MILRTLAILAISLQLFSAPAVAQNDILADYIQDLKKDYAGPRSKTGFLSFGGDFLNAQEYFDARNYEAAARSFRYLVEKDSTHPFANYQLAIALLRQNDSYKTKQAQLYLQKAIQLAPALEKRLATDMPAMSRNNDTDNSNEPITSAQPPIGLQAYIEKLKHSRDTRGPETAMNTPGQSAMYAIEYYETHEYLSAEKAFQYALLSDGSNPYLQYMLAVSLAAQGKKAEANTYFDKSVATDPTLNNSYENDIARASAAWKKLEDSRKVKTAPTPKVTYGGALVFGNYICSQTVYRGPNATPAYDYVEKGYFALKADGTYRWLDDGPVGRYRYNAKTGTITWLSGYLKNNGIKSTKYQRNGKSGQMTVTYSDVYTWQCGCKK